MLANFLFSLNVVIPVFAVMFLGFVLKKRDVINSHFLASGNKLVFYVGLPVLLFRGVYTLDIGEFMNVRFVAFLIIASVTMFFTLWAVAAIFLKEKPVLASFAQGAFRGNFAVMGIPLIINLVGNVGMAPSAIVVVFVVPFFNVCSILVLAQCKGEKVGPLAMILAIAKNPSNIMIAFGIFLTVLGISLPSMVFSAVNMVANLATPMALMCMGGGMVFRGFDAKFKYSLVASVVKVVIMPLVYTTAAVLLGFRGYELAVIVILGGVPSAIICYAMAVQMGGDGDVAANIILISTVMSAFTLTAFIYVVTVMGWV